MDKILYFSVFMILFKHESLAQNRTRRPLNTIPPPEVTRKQHHEPEVISKTCLLKPDKGPCRGNLKMFFFDPSAKSCAVFEWGGCQGNGNRFDTLTECTSTCLSGQGYKRGAPKYCGLSFDYGWCFGAEHRYYYDRFWKVCKKTIYSGCGGNRNNFYNKEQCQRVCSFGLPPLVKPKKRAQNGVWKVVIVNPDHASTKPTPAPTTLAPITEPETTTARTRRTDIGDCGEVTKVGGSG
ncbi:kunitz-type U19-barytoxin-Tl1a-like [Pectinophora gossypiella]|uniref:kunitz-type U19-barytoxin-Tl1a-like n=1 Tax=Pectinophora gossypiella TaxID=13191 RepID=UPI00214F2AAC|nr:kunitz-type U19-barytoxin-Tl1a-like [Pectinophora gossypiella]